MRTTTGAVFGFALAVVLLCGALGWITNRTLGLERAEWDAVARASWEEDIRLSLWQMDAALATWLALENARSSYAYIEHVAESADGVAGAGGPPAKLLRARFEIAADGRLVSHPGIERQPWVERLASGERSRAGRVAGVAPAPAEKAGALEDRSRVGGTDGRQSAGSQSLINVQEFGKRRDLGRQSALADLHRATARALSPLEPRWVDGELLVTRRVERGGQELVQGSWLEWEAVSAWLLAETRELLPGAELHPVARDAERVDPGRRLALLPVALDPGPPPPTVRPAWTPVRWTLTVAWLVVLLALAGIGLLLWQAIALGRRRGDFVSAVTHELRTPLTTFRLYTDLLREGGGDAAERQGYLDTLRREGERLAHLVDNVLAFARLERQPVRRRPESTPLAALVEAVTPTLRERAAREGLALAVRRPADLDDRWVAADAGRAEQILLNLVDNACKYAAGADPPEIHLEVEPAPGRVAIRVRDFGPGVPAEVRRRLFRPFHRAADRAAGNVPGVGLGLALSRRLARSLGGDLRPVEVERGAAFELRLVETGAEAGPANGAR